jgi:hypothetical protein
MGMGVTSPGRDGGMVPRAKTHHAVQACEGLNRAENGYSVCRTDTQDKHMPLTPRKSAGNENPPETLDCDGLYRERRMIPTKEYILLVRPSDSFGPQNPIHAQMRSEPR